MPVANAALKSITFSPHGVDRNKTSPRTPIIRATFNISKPVFVRSFIVINTQSLPLAFLTGVSPGSFNKKPADQSTNDSRQWKSNGTDQHPAGSICGGFFCRHRQIHIDQPHCVPGKKQARHRESHTANYVEHSVNCRCRYVHLLRLARPTYLTPAVTFCS